MQVRLLLVMFISLFCIFASLLMAEQVTVGSGDILNRVPVDMYYENSLYQCLYLQQELGIVTGTISQISFYNDFVTNLPAIQTKIWLGTTIRTDLNSGWIPAGQLSLVYDGAVDYPVGVNTINIPLDTPYAYHGGTLVLMVYKPVAEWYFSEWDRFRAQYVEQNRARRAYNDNTVFDPYSPPLYAGDQTNLFPQTTFTYTGQTIVNDLAVTEILGNNTPSLYVPHVLEVRVKNNGIQAQEGYPVHIKKANGTILASISGENVLPGTTISLILYWTPDVAGNAAIYAEVEAPGDEISYNNASPMKQITVIDATPYSIMIGSGDQTGRMPLDFFYRNSLFETIYYASEINIPQGYGTIGTLGLYYNFAEDLLGMQTRIWMGETTQADLFEGWIPSNELTLVYDSELDFWAGQNMQFFMLDQPYFWNGGNLVLLVQHPYTQDYHSSENVFHTQSGTTLRSMNYVSDSVIIDPQNPPVSDAIALFPKILLGFLYCDDDLGFMYGTVSAAGIPLAGAEILVNNRSITHTNSRGEYWLSMHWGVYHVTVSMEGFQPWSADIILNPGGGAHNFYLNTSSVTDPATPLILDQVGIYPNPFNPTATLQFSVSKDNTQGMVELYDLKGRKLATLEQKLYKRGIHTLILNGKDGAGVALASGVYIVKIQMGKSSRLVKAVLMK
ncbi:MAG: T9SS type A sorting domain-containing protein [Candidatus Cloacimonetes bacterium]|nr:T9SS type A sorting domain-containing protein [Candidatus Cloacimonadota bacterium]